KIRLLSTPTLLPYTTLFRSRDMGVHPPSRRPKMGEPAIQQSAGNILSRIPEQTHGRGIVPRPATHKCCPSHCWLFLFPGCRGLSLFVVFGFVGELAVSGV